MNLMLNRLILLFLSVVTISCSTDFQLTTGGKEMPVIYGILSVDDDEHYIRVEQLFVDEEIAPGDLAMDSSQVFYDNVSVELVKGDQRFMLDRVDAAELGMPRDSGIFLSEPNYLFHIADSELNLQSEDVVSIFVRLPDDSLEASAVAPIVGESVLTNPSPNNPDIKLPFQPRASLSVRWDGDEDAAFYDLYVTVFIREIKNQNIEQVVLEWPVVTAWETERYTIEGSSFFNYLRTSLEADPTVTRRLDSLHMRIDAGGEALQRFVEINNLNTGITSSQVIPNYTNVENGLGLFSSKSSVTYKGYQLSPAAVDSLVNSPIVEALNFNR